MGSLSGRKVIMVLGPRYQDEEGTKPLEFLRGRGAAVDVAGLEKGPLRGQYGRASIEVGLTVGEADPAAYDAMVIPGGKGPSSLRGEPGAVRLVERFAATGRPLAAICHGPQLLAAAGLLEGRRITGYHKIRGEMLQAGADFTDEPVVLDGNLITSRKPGDLEMFNEAIERALTSG